VTERVISRAFRASYLPWRSNLRILHTILRIKQGWCSKRRGSYSLIFSFFSDFREAYFVRSPNIPYSRLHRYETVIKRWPIIITGVIDQLHNACHVYSLQSQQPNPEKALDAKIAEGKGIIEQISRLKYQMARDHPLELVLLSNLFNSHGIRHRFTDLFLRMATHIWKYTTPNWRV
jgi:Damage-control phosphatase ARMT1-like domain